MAKSLDAHMLGELNALVARLGRRPKYDEMKDGLKIWVKAQGGIVKVYDALCTKPVKPKRPARKRRYPRGVGMTQTAIAEAVAEILGTSYEMEKTFDWLVNPETGKSLRIDAYFPSHHLAVEYQSEMHFGKKPRRFRGSDLRDILFRDFVKRTLIAEQPGMKLLEVSFYEPHTVDALRRRLQRMGVVK